MLQSQVGHLPTHHTVAPRDAAMQQEAKALQPEVERVWDAEGVRDERERLFALLDYVMANDASEEDRSAVHGPHERGRETVAGVAESFGIEPLEGRGTARPGLIDAARWEPRAPLYHVPRAAVYEAYGASRGL